MVSPEAIVAITKQRRLDSHELSYKSDASSHFLAPGVGRKTHRPELFTGLTWDRVSNKDLSKA